VLRQLKELKTTLSIVWGWWDIRSMKIDERELRPRTPDEFPEAQRLYWSSTIGHIDEMAAQLEELRTFCFRQFYETPEER
jgi:hypothetical protein